MSRKIYKYTIEATDSVQSVQMSKGATITHLDCLPNSLIRTADDDKVHSFISMWAMFDDDSTEVETRHFVTVPTGKPIDDELLFVGTVVQTSDEIFGGYLVWHVFEKFV